MNKYNKDIVEKWKRGEVALEVDYNKLDEINTFFKELNPRNLTITNKYFKYFPIYQMLSGNPKDLIITNLETLEEYQTSKSV